MIDDGSNLVIHLTGKKIFVGIMSLQLTLLGLMGLGKSGLEIPILRQLIGFIYLTFVPGFAILGLLRVDTDGSSEVLLYSVGLSLSFLMFTGALTISSYPLIGISKPISEMPLLITISIAISALSFIWYLRNRRYSQSYSVNQVFSPSTLCFSLFPFLAILGTYLVNFHENNALLVILLASISAIPVLVALNRISSSKYPFAVWIISISLLLHNSLIGGYVSWGDSEREYLVSRLSLTSGFWDITVSAVDNSLLGIRLLYPIYSLACLMELTWVFKIVYPLLFSFAPVALYLSFRRQLSDKIAFMSSSLFMFSFVFFTVLPRNTRTGISLLFLSLLALLVSDELVGTGKRWLSTVFVLSVAVTYYGLSYVLLLFFYPIALLHFLDRKRHEGNLITLTFASLYFVFALTYFMYTSNSSGFETLVRFGGNYVDHFMEFLTVPRSSLTYYVFEYWSISLEVVKYLTICFMLLTGIGILNVAYQIVKGKKVSFTKDYYLLSVFFSTLFLASLSPLPVNIQRVFQVSLTFLAPFSAIGCIKLSNIIRMDSLTGEKWALKFFSILLLLLLVFGSGVASAVTHDLNPNELINKKHVVTGANMEEKEYFYRMYRFSQDVYSTEWILAYMKRGDVIYGGYKLNSGFAYYYALSEPTEMKNWVEGKADVDYRILSLENQDKIRDCLIRLGHMECNGRTLATKDGRLVDVSEIYQILNVSSKIYDNDGSVIYIVPG